MSIRSGIFGAATMLAMLLTCRYGYAQNPDIVAKLTNTLKKGCPSYKFEVLGTTSGANGIVIYYSFPGGQSSMQCTKTDQGSYWCDGMTACLDGQHFIK